MATDMTPRFDQLRCADQDRELVARVLNNAYAEGRLTFEEHADRIATAYDSKTFGELDALTADLVRAEPQQYAAPSQRPLAAPAPQSAPAPDHPGAYSGGNAILSTLKPGQLGTVASDVTINAWLGDARIDLVGAAFVSRNTQLHIGVMMGEIKIRVPEGVFVNTSRVTTIMGETKVDGLVPHPDGITLLLDGTVIMGEVTILGPATAKQRRYDKLVR